MRRGPTLQALRLSAAGLGALMLTACAGPDAASTTTALTTGSIPVNRELAEGQARLALSRTNGILYAGAPAIVTVNGQRVTELWPGRAADIVVPTGPLRIAVTTAAPHAGSSAIDLEVKDRQVYAIEIAPRQAGLLAGDAQVSPARSDSPGVFEARVVSRAPPQ